MVLTGTLCSKAAVLGHRELLRGAFPHVVHPLPGPCSSNTDTVSSIASESIEASPVIHLVTDAKGNVLHEVHVQMQELPVVDAKPLEADVSAVCLKHPLCVLHKERFTSEQRCLGY